MTEDGTRPHIREERDKLINTIIPLCSEILTKHGLFHPVALFLNGEGQIAVVQEPPDEASSTGEYIALLRKRLREIGEKGEAKAAALCALVALNNNEGEKVGRGMQITVDHVEEEHAIVCILPYQQDEEGNVSYGQSQAQAVEERLLS